MRDISILDKAVAVMRAVATIIQKVRLTVTIIMMKSIRKATIIIAEVTTRNNTLTTISHLINTPMLTRPILTWMPLISTL